MKSVTMKDLLSSGVHFGHQTSKWNPKMKPYIFGARNGIYIVDLQKTVKMLNKAMEFVKEEVSNGKNIIFVGTKTQAKDVVKEEAVRCGAYYITHRWLGGLLTNFRTIQRGIERWEEIEKMKEDGTMKLLSKKETSKLEKERIKLEETFEGIRGMKKHPNIIFAVDSNHEDIAVLEAKKLGITVVGLVDTNSDPDNIDYIIPGNDDAIKSIRLFTSMIAEAVLEGKAGFEEKARAEGDNIEDIEEDLENRKEEQANIEDDEDNVVVEKIRTLEKNIEEDK
jgi:small subunit ribosomal protein S2